MPVIHLVRDCPLSVSPAIPAGYWIRPFGPSDTAAVATLTGSLQPSLGEPGPTAFGLLADMSGRPGREVEAWVAIPDSSLYPEVAGLATLVTSMGDAGLRRSIAWLLVHPSVRRCGIGRALVETMCREVAMRDQPAIWVECHTKWQGTIAFWRTMDFRERKSGGASPGR